MTHDEMFTICNVHELKDTGDICNFIFIVRLTFYSNFMLIAH